jgi:hypothetical protein
MFLIDEVIMKVDKTIKALDEEFGCNDDQLVRYVFDKLENERSLFWIQVARTIANRYLTYSEMWREDYLESVRQPRV